MKYFGRAVLCLPLLILSIDYQTNDSTDGVVNDLAIEYQRGGSLSLNKSHANEGCPPDVNDCMTVVGKKPPSMYDPFDPFGNMGGGDSGGGYGGGYVPPEAPSDPGIKPEPPKDKEKEEKICLERADTAYFVCKDEVFAKYSEAVANICPAFVDVEIGVKVIFGGITVRNYDSCMNIAAASKDRYLNGCDIMRSVRRTRCFEQ